MIDWLFGFFEVVLPSFFSLSLSRSSSTPSTLFPCFTTMPKSLVSNKTTVSHKGSKRTHIRFSERESALDETKSAVRLVVEADALCTHSHGLKWSSSSSVGAPSLSNPAVTPFTTTQAAQVKQSSPTDSLPIRFKRYIL